MRYVFGDYSLDTQRYELRRAGELIPLGPQVFNVLAYLITHRDRVVSRDELFERLWPDQFVTDDALGRCIRAARRALEDPPEAPRYILTTRGRGYRFIAPVQEQPHGPPEDGAATGPTQNRPPLSSVAGRAGLPPPVALPMGAGERQHLAGEYKPVMVLCGGLADALALARRLGPEAMHRHMQTVFTVVHQVLQHYGGSLLEFVGEGFVALFGAPVAQEDHAQRAVPETIEAVLAARLDRLLPEEKRLLQTAAVIGIVVPVPLLQAVTDLAAAELHTSLGHFQAAEFLYETGRPPELAYTFKHALTQEVAYGSLLQEQRRVLHGRAAQAIEGLFAERLPEHYYALAHHYSRSGHTAEAVDYLQRSGLQAVERSAYAEAVSHLTTALDLLLALPETRQRSQLELGVQMTLGIAPGHQDLAVSQATEATRDRSDRLALLAETFAPMGQITRGLEALAEGLATVAKNRIRWWEAELYRLRGELLLQQTVVQPEEAEACFQQALAVAHGEQAKSWELRAATSLARLWQRQGKQAAAHELIAPVYGWFTEGFDTVDLREAKILLEELAG
jgi:DNA-binding winged helix-turn-helix (wHTH) protein